MNSLHKMSIEEQEERLQDLLIKLYKEEKFMSPNSEIKNISIGKEFVQHLNELSQNLIPYHVLTQFVYDPVDEREIHQFADNIYQSICRDYPNNKSLQTKALKIRFHLKLAEQQKESLYSSQKAEITSMTANLEKVNSLSKKIEDDLENMQDDISRMKTTYDNLLSQYISILGIFAAILMTAFGAIQGFTAIYSKDNGFSLVDSILIASIGFMGVLLLLFYLMSSISKMTGKSLDSAYGVKWYNKHPTLINSFIILSTISLTCIAYKVSLNPPVLSWWGSVYLVPILYFVVMRWLFNRKHPEEKNRRNNNNQK